MKRFSFWIALWRGIVATVVLVGLASAAYAQTINTFNVPNSTYTVPQADNLFGQITGYYQDANFVVHGFLRQPNSTFVTFDVTGSTDTEGTAMNDFGQITGYYRGADNAYHGFVRQKNGAIASFNAPNSPDPDHPDVCEWRTTGTFAKAINLAGQIAGVHQQVLVGIAGLICAGIRFQGFLRNHDGTIITFGISLGEHGSAEFVGPHGINLPGNITGWYQATDIGGPIGGFLRQRGGTITRFLDDDVRSVTHAAAINLFGQITGYYLGGDNAYHGFLRQPNGAIVTFDVNGSTDTEATAINDFGQITGYYRGADNAYHGFVRQRNGAISTFEVPGAATGNQGGTFPNDINLGGQITGYYQDANFVLHGFVRSPR